MDILQKTLNNLALQQDNIMSADASEVELIAINEQTRQITAVSKQVVDIYRLGLDASKFAHQTGADVYISKEMLSIGHNKLLDTGDGDRHG